MGDQPKTLPGPTALAPAITLARLGIVRGANNQVAPDDWVDVHFNPISLQLQVSNELKDTKNNERKQYVAKSNAKLTMDLLFDTTDTGDDVTTITRRVQAFLQPDPKVKKEPPPPLVLFEWGTLRFKGIAESYKETIDFFSADGVPLRAQVNLTLSRQDKVFDESPEDAPEKADVGGAQDDLDLVDAPAGSPADAAAGAGSPGAARGIAAANGLESVRFGAGASLTVGASVELKAAAAFATGEVGFGASAGVGASAGAGFGLGLDAGASAGISLGGSVSAGFGASASFGGGANFGGSASAGASFGFGASASASASFGAGVSAGLSGLAGRSASEGAFAGLRVTTSSSGAVAALDPRRLLPTISSSVAGTAAGATFRVGGRAETGAPAGLRADVGAGASFGARGRITFDSP